MIKKSKVNGASRTLPQKFPYRPKFHVCAEFVFETIADLEALRSRQCKTHRTHNFRLQNF